MLLWIALAFSLVGGLIDPFSKRLLATILWAGKAMVPPEMAASMPRGCADALADGWPSNLVLSGYLKIVGCMVGFFHSWWAGLIALFLPIILSAVLSQTSLASPYVERYLTLLLHHALRRAADYALKGDLMRNDAAKELADELVTLLNIYTGTSVLVPTMKQVTASPFGDTYFLLDMSKSRNCTSNAHDFRPNWTI